MFSRRPMADFDLAKQALYETDFCLWMGIISSCTRHFLLPQFLSVSNTVFKDSKYVIFLNRLSHYYDGLCALRIQQFIDVENGSANMKRISFIWRIVTQEMAKCRTPINADF